MKFRITGAKGYQMTFKNGWTASVQFGVGNYCSNQTSAKSQSDACADIVCDTAEVAAWDSKGDWHHFGRGENWRTVLGWQNPNDVAKFLAKIARKP